jgi:hypothetical protein
MDQVGSRAQEARANTTNKASVNRTAFITSTSIVQKSMNPFPTSCQNLASMGLLSPLFFRYEATFVKAFF